MPTPVDADRLESFPVFASLTAEQRGEVAAAMSEVTVEPGKALATEGEYAYQLFAIEDGQAEVRKGGELIRTLGPGDVFGEIGLHATGTRTATVVATTPMRLAAIFTRELRRIERETPDLERALRDLMAERAARTGF